MTQNTPNQPATKLKEGRISCTIWQNGSDDKPRFTFGFERSYRDADGQWKSTSSFDSDDTMAILILTQQAFSTITELRRQAYSGDDTVDV